MIANIKWHLSYIWPSIAIVSAFITFALILPGCYGHDHSPGEAPEIGACVKDKLGGNSYVDYLGDVVWYSDDYLSKWDDGGPRGAKITITLSYGIDNEASGPVDLITKIHDCYKG
jgi:hypothetical protein